MSDDMPREMWYVMTIRGDDGILSGCRLTSWFNSRESAVRYAEDRARQGDKVVRVTMYQRQDGGEAWQNDRSWSD